MSDVLPLDGCAAVLPRARQPDGRSAPPAVVLLAVLVAAGALLPLGFIVGAAIETGWTSAIALIVRPRVAELLANTLLLLAVTLPAATLVAVTLAWLTERTDLPGARLWAWLAVAPLAIPAFVQGYAWSSLAPGLGGLVPAATVSTAAYFPFIYLPVAAQLRRLDPAIEEAAASLGLSPLAVFVQAVLPQLRLALCGGALLVGLHLLAEYGLFALIRFDTFATAIVDQFQSSYSGPAATMLAIVLVAGCLGLMALEALLRGRERYARVGSGAPRPPNRQRLGRLAPLALLWPAAVAAVALGVPLATLGRWLLIGGLASWHDPAVVHTLAQTLGLALGGAVLTTLAALPMAWMCVRAPGRLQRALEACHNYVGALPGVVVALALVAVTVRVALPLYQTVATVLLAYALLFLPRAVVALRASLAQAPLELERAAAALGKPPLAAFWLVTVRLAAPGAGAAMALVALGIATELTATLLLAPTGTDTLATRFWILTSEIDYVAAAPYALMMVLLSLPLTIFLHVHAQRVVGR